MATQKVLKMFAAMSIGLAASAHAAECDVFRFPLESRSNYSGGFTPLPLRTDYPTVQPSSSYAWEAIEPTKDWRRYMTEVLNLVKSSGVTIAEERVQMPATANWWIAPWMDYGPDGREKYNGLTRERGPDPRDLAPNSKGDMQVWAVGWYNAEGAYSLGQVFNKPCDPRVPETGWKFLNKTVSFKFLFIDDQNSQLPYLQGAPKVKAHIYPETDPRSDRLDKRTDRDMRLLQVDIAVRDPNAIDTEWVMGTFVWMGPAVGDGIFDNLQPVGLAWGDDPGKFDPQWNGRPKLEQSALNEGLPHTIWQRGTDWPHRPFPGFQGRLNGPADNMRSSCISCHGLAQWPRNTREVSGLGANRNFNVGIVPRYATASMIDRGEQPLTADQIVYLGGIFFTNVRGGLVAEPTRMERPTDLPADRKTKAAISLDYSLQLEAGLARMCRACSEGKLVGDVPLMCRPENGGRITRPSCGTNLMTKVFEFLGAPSSAPLSLEPRQ